MNYKDDFPHSFVHFLYEDHQKYLNYIFQEIYSIKK